MCSVILTLQIAFTYRWRHKFTWSGSAQGIEPFSSFSLFCGHSWLSRAFQHPITTLRGCSKNKLCVLLSLTRAPLGFSAHLFIPDAHDAWLLFRRKTAINTQQLCKYSQCCRCLPTASNTPYWVFESKSPLLFSLWAWSSCLHCQPCINRLATALLAGGSKADSLGGMWYEWARKLRPEGSLQISAFSTGQMTGLGSISLLGLFSLFPVPLENGELWISCSMLRFFVQMESQKNVF